MRTVPAVVVAAVFLAISGRAQTLTGPALDGDLIFMLDSASTYQAAPVNFYIRVDNGRWETDIMTTAVRHGQSVHVARVTGVSGTVDSFQIRASITIPENPWGGNDAVAGYSIDMLRHGDTLSGRFMGHMNGTPVRGPAVGRLYANRLPAPIEGFDGPAPGEHPRLFFRAADIPAIKAKAETEGGKVIVDTLRKMLARKEYTLWDGVGWGILYILTGETAYADSGRSAVSAALGGAADAFNGQYSWTNPPGQLRAGPSVAAVAMAYDLCYNGWSAAFRDSIALRIQEYGRHETDTSMSLERLSLRTRHLPGSNHWGAQVGGAGLAVLAIMGDPGTDSTLLAGYLKQIRRNALRNLYEGFGDGGYYAEHPGPGHVASNTAFVPYVQAEFVCGGADFLTPRPNARWISMRWAHEMLPSSVGPLFPLRTDPGAAGYGSMYFDEDGTSHGGQFVQGMGTVTDSQRLALAWTYEQAVAGGNPGHFYGVGIYPHRAMFALVNWPLGRAPLNPEGIVPHTRRDNVFGYHSFRKGWFDRNDVIVTALTDWHLRWSFIDKDGQQNPIFVWGHGIRTTGPATFFMEHTFYTRDYGNGTGVVSCIPVAEGIETRPEGGARPTSFAVDFAGDLTGVEAVIVATGPKAHEGKDTAVAGASTHSEMVVCENVIYQVMTLQTGEPPAIETDGDIVRINDREVWFDGEKLILARRGEIAARGRPAAGRAAPPLTLSRKGRTVVVRLASRARALVTAYDARGAIAFRGAAHKGVLVLDTKRLAKGVYVIGVSSAGLEWRDRFAVR